MFPWGKPTNFVQKILCISGYTPKVHTFRHGTRWMSGKIIHFCTGMRTKNYKCFKSSKCKSVQRAKITITHIPSHTIWVLIDDRLLSDFEVSILAKNDGFESVQDFAQWFKDGFSGQLVHWTDLKY